MASRPKSILWVDDEIEGLESHRRFLADQGYEVAAATHGDDALELLRRQAYGLVLVDEQMPGRRGLELFHAIRELDPAVPVVMVTKSEDPAVLREAIGMAVDDYLVKPLHPRQILSVVTRLLEGDRIRQQHLSREFVTRFRELEARRGTALGWREWIDVWRELMQWDLKLAEAAEPGLAQALQALMGGLRRDFASFIVRNYPRWIAQPDADRPALSPDVVEEMVLPVLREHGRVLFVVVDCLRLDQWEALLPQVTPLFDVETSHYFSILPSATPYSRNAIFAGLLPRDIAAQHPAWWTEHEEDSLNAHEHDLLARQLERVTGRPVPCRYEKLFGTSEGEDVQRRLPAMLAQDGVTAMVFNFVDQLTHGRSENAILYEVARDAAALRALTCAWFERSPLKAALVEAERRRVPVVLTTDHGSIHCLSPATVYAKRDATNNLRFKFGEDLRPEDPASAITVEDPLTYGLPARGLGVRCVIATEDRFFVYPTKLREYQARYRGAFLHGGASPEEMILPVALLQPRSGR
ncbi:MAG TPA: bifunctional response regulator/alkaline phosphatase family protein [Gemmatimonadales bacterium]|nr:bifunctional response regulator/alkaline phosphatase family protein [Gemmatimonadales bacterium]